MNSLTFQQERDALIAACKENELDEHLQEVSGRPNTAAEKIMWQEAGRKGRPYKSSYMYCDTVDVCFFFTDSGRPRATFTASWGDGAKDLAGAARKALGRIDEMLCTMRRLADATLKGEEAATNEKSGTDKSPR